MMPLLIPMPGNERLARAIAVHLGTSPGKVEVRAFPDGESHVRLRTDPADRHVHIICTLARPDPQFLPLIFAAGAARDQGAASVQLIAPYLAYLRQDRCFKKGEAVSSRHFAALLSSAFDGLITVDPHLHRIHDLGEIYSIPARVVRSAPLLADWVVANVATPLIVGPDAESAQWVAEVARHANAPFVLLDKVRHGDRDVVLRAAGISRWRGLRPVLVDDIISSGATIEKAAHLIAAAGLERPHVLAVHALFDAPTAARLKAVTASMVSTDTAAHRSNGLEVAPLIARAIAQCEKVG